MRADPDTCNVQFDWDEPAERSVHFEVDQTKARQLNVSSAGHRELSADVA